MESSLVFFTMNVFSYNFHHPKLYLITKLCLLCRPNLVDETSVT